MIRKIGQSLVVSLAIAYVQPTPATECLQDVIGNLYTDLESIDGAGEAALKEALDTLAAQERWSEFERSEFTLSISDNPEVDAAESARTDILARMFALAQRGEQHCAEVRSLRDEALALERAQWDAALQQVNQRIAH